MKKAQPMPCHDCGRIIGARKHHILSGLSLRCYECFTWPGKHAEAFPNCPHEWHDMYDHGTRLATRAAAAHILAKSPTHTRTKETA